MLKLIFEWRLCVFVTRRHLFVLMKTVKRGKQVFKNTFLAFEMFWKWHFHVSNCSLQNLFFRCWREGHTRARDDSWLGHQISMTSLVPTVSSGTSLHTQVTKMPSLDQPFSITGLICLSLITSQSWVTPSASGMSVNNVTSLEVTFSTLLCLSGTPGCYSVAMTSHLRVPFNRESIR